MTAGEDNVNTENPYEVSRFQCDNAIHPKPYASPDDFDIENNLIVCGSHLILPPICVYTGVTEDLVEIQRHTVFPSMRLVVVQRFCYVVMSVARSEQTRRRKTASLIALVTTIGFSVSLAALFMKGRQTAILFPMGLLIAGISLFLLHRHNLPLRLVRYKAPGIYWVKGFPKAFLAQLAMNKLNDIGQSSRLNEADTKSRFEI